MNNNLISEYRGRCNSCTSTVHCIRHERQLDDSVSKLLAYTTELAKYVSGILKPETIKMKLMNFQLEIYLTGTLAALKSKGK